MRRLSGTAFGLLSVAVGCSDDAAKAPAATASAASSTLTGTTAASSSSTAGSSTSTTSTTTGSVTGGTASVTSSSASASVSGAGGATAQGGAATTGTQSSTSAGTTAGTTGGSLASSVCPAGSESMTPVLTGTPAPVAGVPPNDAYDPFNIEGPVWVNGALYLSEIANGQNPPAARILKYTPGVGVEIWKDDVGTNGLAIDTSGTLYGASHKDGSVSSFALNDPSQAPRPIVSQYLGQRFSSPNDLTISGAGRVYFTDPFYQAGPERQAEERAYWFELANPGVINVIAGTPSQPNGITLSPDERTLYIAGSSSAMAYPVSSDGSLGGGSTFGPAGVDGMGVDCAGNVYLALYEAGEIVVLSSTGAELGRIAVGNGVTNVAFGGNARTTLYISRLTTQELYEVDVGIPGLPY